LLQEGEFLSNKKNGEWKRYNAKGELDYHAEFKDGKQVKKI